MRDLEIVRWQIRRRISGFLKVIRRCSWGYPQVIQCYPLLGGKPFPTLYWLTCPFLNSTVGALESQGKVEEFRRKVLLSSKFKRKLASSHECYAEERFSLLGNGIRGFLAEYRPSYLEVIARSGIGGVSTREGVKCLHAHLAYWLVGGKTPIGELIAEELSSLECLDNPKCAVIEFRLQSWYNGKGGKENGVRSHRNGGKAIRC